MRPRFEPDFDSTQPQPADPRFVDPDSVDPSEAEFAASLDAPPARARFEVQPSEESAATLAADPSLPISEVEVANDDPAPLLQSQDNGAWRDEVADRVNKYRARRRPREPRYPSLMLKFEPTEPAWSSGRDAGDFESPPPATHQSLAMDSAPAFPEAAEAQAASLPAETGRLIEFPRALTVPPRPVDELAEPVFDKPRIIEAPDVALPPPALGGILIEQEEDQVLEKRPGFEIPLQPAPWSRRVGAVVADAVIVLSAVAMFVYIFFRIAGELPALPLLAGYSVLVTGLFWAGYQYLLLVYSGSTPGLRLARLALNRFDGEPVPRSLRRWRVLASVLSGASLGLGYAWCFLDEDQLCWHDRITRTYAAPKRNPGTA